MKKFIVIVPDMPPNINGVGDYALLLLKKFAPRIIGYDLSFLVAGNINYQDCIIEGFKINHIEKSTSSELVKCLIYLNSDIVHLHYVGYGYSKRGVAYWILKGLNTWKECTGGNIITTFHELYAISIKPWTSSFWNQLFQVHVCRSLIQISDLIFTSTDVYSKKLARFSGGRRIYNIPVFSNLGELEVRPSFAERKRHLVVLGSRDTRKYIYTKYSELLNTVARNLQVSCIVDIGESVVMPKSFDIPVIQMGRLSSSSVSKILSECAFGVTGGYSNYLYGKSGVFAAYAAHGIVVIALHFDQKKWADRLQVGDTYLSHKSIFGNYEIISSKVFDWYRSHSINAHADFYVSLFKMYFDKNLSECNGKG